jgi:hypothetical protein
MKRSNKELGIYKINIKYLDVVKALIKHDKVSAIGLNRPYLVGLLNIGTGSGAFRYEKGTPTILKQKELKIISINEDSFKIKVSQ